MPNLHFDYTDRSVVVTGSARGIGLATASFFRARGADVFLVDIDADEVARAAAGIGAFGIGADVAHSADVQRVIDTVTATTARIDVLVNNAGILRDRVLWKLEDDDWNSVLDVHLGGTFRFTRACVPIFRAQRYGRVVNITSYSGLHGNLGQSNYAAAKAGIIGFTKTAAKELARIGVTVNAVSPNAETRMITSIPPERRAELTAAIPLGRFAEPDEMAMTIGFLASEEAGYVTGTVLAVDGGLSM